MHDIQILVYLIIALALVFDFINGFHDAANSIATIVSTRVLTPGKAVLWAAFFNFIAFLIFDVKVAHTIGKGIIQPQGITVSVISAGLVGAIVWNLVTWYYGIPSSSSHALVGGFAGAAVARAGADVLISSGMIKITLFIFLAPIVGMILGFLFMIATYWICRWKSPSKVNQQFGKLQLLSAAAYSIGHGGNDAQKTMGIIFILLITTGQIPKGSDVPFWVVIACHVAMGLGTMMGGWRIVKTMGQKICKLQPVHGFCAETAGAAALYGATISGIPVSTTHTITGSIFGVGSTRGPNAVKWGIVGRVIWAWILTIPCSAFIATVVYFIINYLLKPVFI